MLAIEINNCLLQVTERPLPKISEHEVLIKVAAAGINRPDIMQRKGLYPPPKGASDIPGLEISGTIIKVGRKVTHVKLNDKVCALVTGGGYAEFAAANATLCLPIPQGFDFIQAAALPETFFTVWSNLIDRAILSKDETILIHGGSSGIGTTAIQIAKSFHAKVIVTASTQKKCNFCESIGADLAINYLQTDFVTEALQFTNNQGVDVILDIIGGDYFQRNLNCMGYDARLLQIAFQNDFKIKANLLPIMLKRLIVTGSTLRNRHIEFKQQIAKQLFEKIWPQLESGTISPIIDQTFPMQDAANAHVLMESNQHIGKIILTI